MTELLVLLAVFQAVVNIFLLVAWRFAAHSARQWEDEARRIMECKDGWSDKYFSLKDGIQKILKEYP